jgi:hypothetical protein
MLYEHGEQRKRERREECSFEELFFFTFLAAQMKNYI